jgi:hypothetical protein
MMLVRNQNIYRHFACPAIAGREQTQNSISVTKSPATGKSPFGHLR